MMIGRTGIVYALLLGVLNLAMAAKAKAMTPIVTSDVAEVEEDMLYGDDVMEQPAPLDMGQVINRMKAQNNEMLVAFDVEKELCEHLDTEDGIEWCKKFARAMYNYGIEKMTTLAGNFNTLAQAFEDYVKSSDKKVEALTRQLENKDQECRTKTRKVNVTLLAHCQSRIEVFWAEGNATIEQVKTQRNDCRSALANSIHYFDMCKRDLDSEESKHSKKLAAELSECEQNAEIDEHASAAQLKEAWDESKKECDAKVLRIIEAQWEKDNAKDATIRQMTAEKDDCLAREQQCMELFHTPVGELVNFLGSGKDAPALPSPEGENAGHSSAGGPHAVVAK